MKKLFSTLFFLGLLSISNAQVIDKGKILIDAGIGLGIQHYQFTDLTTHASTPRDTSGALEIPVMAEYGIKRWIGAGMIFNYAKYLTDSASKNETYKGVDFIPTVYLHIPWGLKKIDLGAHLGYGYSHFKYIANNSSGVQYTAGGSVFNWGITFHWLFTTDGHVGLNLWYSHAAFNYPNGLATDNAGNRNNFSLDGPGNNFGLGLFARF